MGLFDGIASLVNTGVNAYMQRDINQFNNEQQWAMWRATNEYNSPAAQMQRYKDAGLNPNLIYGQQNTASPVQVGTAQAPKSSISGFGNPFLDFANMLSVKQDVHRKELENHLLEQTLEERKKSFELGNDKTVSEIDKNKSDISVNEKMIDKMQSDIERNGYLNTLSQLDAQIKNFETEDFDRLRKIRQNELEKSNNSVESSKLLVTNQKLQNELLGANIELATFQLQLDYAEYVLKNALTEESLSRIGLNETEAKKKLQEIDNMKKQIDVMASQIDLNQSNIDMNDSNIFTNKVRRQKMRWDIGSDWFKNIFGNRGVFQSAKDGMSAFKLATMLLK